jgi:transposase
MSLQPQLSYVILDETRRVAHAAFSQGALCLRLVEVLGQLYLDEQFAALFPTRGQPAASPARLALVLVLQYVEGLSARQAADAVRGRIDWKYALGLELTDPGFAHTVLSEFRTRLLSKDADRLLLDTLLERLRKLGLIKPRGRQCTDSTYVLAAVRRLNCLERVGETMRAALNELAVVAPEWLQKLAPPHWYERYAKRVENYALPKSHAARQELASVIASDGEKLLTMCRQLPLFPHAPLASRPFPRWSRKLDEVRICARCGREILIRRDMRGEVIKESVLGAGGVSEMAGRALGRHFAAESA